MKRGLVNGYFQDEDEGLRALARTQVYLGKNKLGEYKQVSSWIYTKSTSEGMMS